MSYSVNIRDNYRYAATFVAKTLAETMEKRPEVLAYHFAEARNLEKAVIPLCKCARASMLAERSVAKRPALSQHTSHRERHAQRASQGRKAQDRALCAWLRRRSPR